MICFNQQLQWSIHTKEIWINLLIDYIHLLGQYNAICLEWGTRLGTADWKLLRKLGCRPAIREQGQKECAWCILTHPLLVRSWDALPSRWGNSQRQAKGSGLMVSRQSVRLCAHPRMTLSLKDSSPDQCTCDSSLLNNGVSLQQLRSYWSAGSWHLGLLHMLRALLLLLMLLKRTEGMCVQKKAALFRGCRWETLKCRRSDWGDCGPDNWTGDFRRKQEMLRNSEERWQTLLCLLIYLFVGFGRD